MNNDENSDRPQTRPRVLVTGSGSGRANNLVRSLQARTNDVEVIGCHSDLFILAKSETEWRFHAPPPSFGAGFIAALQPVVATKPIDLVIPSSDEDALALAKIRDQLPCRVYLPSLEVIALCQDKYVLTQALQDKGIAVPETLAIRDRSDIAKAFRQLSHGPLLWCRTRHGAGSKGATKVKDADQAWSWISYWHEMRGIPIEEFTLSEYLPGRDFNVQGIWRDGRAVLLKMCERLSYLDGENRPSGMSSTPAIAKTLRDDDVLDTCDQAIKSIAPNASGVFNLDLKQDVHRRARITEINAGRFAMITNIYDFTGRHNMAQLYVRLALGQVPDIKDPRDIVPDHYLVRDYDTNPLIASLEEIASNEGFARAP
jgi:predicted ATP-grasp superfamily ATP-dependent carboligase